MQTAMRITPKTRLNFIIDNANSMCACRGNKVQKQRCWNECHDWQMATLKEHELRCIAEDIIFDCKPDKDRLQDLNSQNPGSLKLGRCQEEEALLKDLDKRMRETNLNDEDEVAKLENFISEAAKGRDSWKNRGLPVMCPEVIF